MERGCFGENERTMRLGGVAVSDDFFFENKSEDSFLALADASPVLR